ncbi:MAG: hypothetical protein LQ342_007525 [Letrouitia transgressa]|nr:MAG: hypothetical protein LQ342_007525 [Letrouitia transgressa]
MLRRKPTAITLTSEDVAAYEDARAAKALGENVAARRDAQAGFIDPNDELKPLPGDKARIVRPVQQSRDERIGLGR